MGVQYFELRGMVDQALGCPEKGIVNFNVLHSLLHEILNHLDCVKAEPNAVINRSCLKEAEKDCLNLGAKPIDELNVDYKDRNEEDQERRPPSLGERRSFPRWDATEQRLGLLESKFDALTNLPTDQSVVADVQQAAEDRTEGNSRNTLAMMWKFMTLHRRVQATEEAVEKTMNMLNDVLQDINQLKHLGSEVTNLREQQSKLAEDFIGVKGDVLPANLDKVTQFAKQFESLDALAFKKDLMQFVTWSALEQALNNKVERTMLVSNTLEKTKVNETSPERPETAPISSSTVWETVDPVPPKTAMPPKEFTKLTGHSPEFETDKGNMEKSAQEKHIADSPLSSKENSLGEISLNNSLKRESDKFSRESAEDSFKPSPELITQLNRLGELPKQHDDVAVQVSTISDLQSKLASEVHKVAVDILPQKVDKNDLQLPDKLMEQIERLKQGLDLLNTNKDLQMLGSIKAISVENKENIDNMKRELGLFSQHLKRIDQPRPRSPESNAPSYDQDALNSVRNDLSHIQDEQKKTTLKNKEDLDRILENLDQKQRFIDDLFQYAERLQESKADRENVATEMDVKADKHALESKVNRSTFDETFELFDRGLQEALQKMEEYMNEEMALKDTLSRISHEMEGKIDNDSLQLMKDYFEKQIKDVQESRDKIARETHVNPNDAAGVRRKMPIHYHCISCNRPVEVSVRDSEPALPGTESLPMRRLKFPFTSYEIEQLRQRSLKGGSNTEENAALHDYMSGRPCGGSHTVINSQIRKSTKLHQFSRFSAARDDGSFIPKISREVSVLDFLRGSDGHYYKGRTRQLLPSISRRDKTSFKAKQASAMETSIAGHDKTEYHQSQRTPSPPLREKYVDNLSSSYPEKSCSDSKMAKLSVAQNYSSDDINIPSSMSLNRESIKILQTRRKRAQEKESRPQRCWEDSQDKSNDYGNESSSPKSIKRTTPVGQEESCSPSPEPALAGTFESKNGNE